MPKAMSRTRKNDNATRRSPPITRSGTIKGKPKHTGDDQSHSKAGKESQSQLRRRKGACPKNLNKPGTDCLDPKLNLNKPGTATKSHSPERRTGQRAAAAWWFQRRANISGERAKPSYACECNIPIEMQDWLVPISYSLALWNFA